jgi:hypothetical protein
MLKRLITTGGAALLSLALASTAGAAPPEGRGGPPRDAAVGAGATGSDAGQQRIAFAAHGGPTTVGPTSGTGDPVTGHFRSGGEVLELPNGQDVGEFQLEGPVTCLIVVGNTAQLFYPVKQGRPQVTENMGVLIRLVDNGKPRGGQSTDLVGFALVPDENPDRPSEQDVNCLTPFPAVTAPLQQGDIRVYDADPSDGAQLPLPEGAAAPGAAAVGRPH